MVTATAQTLAITWMDRSDRLVLVVYADHALARRKSVAFGDTLEYDYIGLHESSAIHAFLRQHSDLLHRPIKQRIQVGNFEAACRMIEAGVGIGILPDFFAADDPTLVPVLREEVEIRRSFWLVTHSDMARLARIEAVADLIRAQVRRTAERGLMTG